MRQWMRLAKAAGSLCLLAVVACSGDPEPRDVSPPMDDDGGSAGGQATAGMSPPTAGKPAADGGSGGSPSAPAAGSGGSRAAGTAGSGGSTSAPPAPMKPAPTLVGDVMFSVPSGTFRDELTVTLTTNVAGAEIRFTTDGQEPNASAKLYGEPVHLSATTQLRAQAFSQGAASGKPSTAIYIARTFDFASDLPIVVIDGYGAGKPMDKNVYKDAAFMVFEPNEGMASLASKPTIATRSGYHVRGQSSARLPQTPYRIELWNSAGEDEDYALLGMPADSDWALIPPYYDRSLVRNPLVYELGRELGLPAPRVRFAEVYVNYEGRALAATDYLGVYWVTETIKNNGDRLDLKQLEPKDTAPELLSGGYIFKFDQAAAEEPKLNCTGSPPISTGVGFGAMMGPGSGTGGGGTAPPAGMRGTCWTDLEVVDPEPLAPEQAAWLTDYLQKFQTLLHATPLGDYEAFIDIDSFVNYLIINELTRNVDSYVRSAYYHKDRGELLRAGPLWDYNFSLGVGGQNSLDPMGGWQYRGTRNINDWYPKLTGDAAFMERVKARWNTLRMGPLSDDAIGKRIDALIEPLTQAAVRDYEKWHVADILKPNAFVRGPSATTWDGQVQALRDFVRARAAWMDSQMR